MRNLLAFAAAAVIAFLGVGWYLGWYAVRPVKTDPGHTGYSIDIDSKKIGSDVVKYGQKVEDFLDKQSEAATKPEEKKPAVKDGSPLHFRGLDTTEEAEARPRSILPGRRE